MSVRNQSINLDLLGGEPFAVGSDTESILLDTPAGRGSTNTGVVRFSGLPSDTATYVLSDSASDGTSIKIARSGIYQIDAQIGLSEGTAGDAFTNAVTVDSTVLTASTAFLPFARARGDSFVEVTAQDTWQAFSGIAVITSAQASGASGVVRLQTTNTSHTIIRTFIRLTRFQNFSS